MLTSPSDTVHMRAGATQFFAFFRAEPKGLEVTLLFSEPEGPSWRTRVSLADGQSHAIRLTDDHDDEVMLVSLRRVGATVEVIGNGPDGLAHNLSN